MIAQFDIMKKTTFADEFPIDMLGEGSEITKNNKHGRKSIVLSRFANLQIEDVLCDLSVKGFVSTLHPEIEGL
jgi:hypothetical protein